MRLKELLAERAPDDRRTFDERVRRLRTERELDLLFRDMLQAERQKHPAMVATANLLDTLLRGRKLDDLNPVTTAGSMQVSVRWAMAHAKELGMPSDELAVRDALYTRAGGLRFGVARLWTYPAAYRESLWRFADYNAGEYAVAECGHPARPRPSSPGSRWLPTETWLPSGPTVSRARRTATPCGPSGSSATSSLRPWATPSSGRTWRRGRAPSWSRARRSPRSGGRTGSRPASHYPPRRCPRWS